MSKHSAWLLSCGICLLIVLFSYWTTSLSMLLTWWNIGTYTHGLAVLPICAWLLWEKKAIITHYEPQPHYTGLAVLAFLVVLWLAAERVGLLGVQQFVLIALLQTLLWTLLGTAFIKQLLFPLLFLYLAVPFGDFLIQPMMEFTADFTVAMLRLMGLPVYRNGLMFTLPSGNWSVVEACSGVRYLIASITIGILYAYLNYTRWHKRLIYALLSLIVPVIANGLRACLIVIIGHLSNMTLAVGVDHLLYGWVFFGLVMALMMWVGSYFQDQPVNFSIPESSQTNTANAKQRFLRIACCAMLIATSAPWLAHFDQQVKANTASLAQINLPASEQNWQLDTALDVWQAEYAGYDLKRVATYYNDTATIQITMLFYMNEVQGEELINGENWIVSVAGDWRLVSEQDIQIETSAKQALSLRESLISAQAGQRLVWQTNWINGVFSSNDTNSKWLTAKQRLIGKPSHSIGIILSTPSAENTEEAHTALSQFIATMWPAIEQRISQFQFITQQDTPVTSARN